MKSAKINRTYWRYSLLSALCALLVMLICCAVNGVSPFGEMNLLSNDAVLQYAPMLAEAQRAVREGGVSLYSWHTGLGANYFATVCYYLLNPFNAVALFFPPEKVTTAYTVVILLSGMLAAGCAAWYLQHRFQKSDLSTVLFALLYTFCGFFFTYYYNTMWLVPFALLPLVALGIEKLTNGGKPWLYLVSLAVSIFSNFYLGYMLCIFSVLYFFVCLFSRRVNKKGEDDVVLLPTLLKFAGASLAAGGLCAVTLLPVMQALSTAYVKSIFEAENWYFFNFADFLTAHLPGIFPPSMVMTEDTIPTVMLGSMPLLLLPLYAFVKDVPKNERAAHIVLTLLFWASFEIPTVYYAWHGFSAPAGLPYRFAFIYAFVLVKMAYTVWVHLSSVRKPMWIFSGICLAAMYVYGFVKFKNAYAEVLSVGAVFTAVLLAVVILLHTVPKAKKPLTAAALVLTVAQLCLCGTDIFMGIPEKNYLPFRAGIAAATETIDAQETDAFYRVELADNNYVSRSDINVSGVLQAGAAYGYNGVSVFSSLTDSNFSFLQYDLGNYGNMSNGYAYTTQTPVYNTLFGVKYLLDNTGTLGTNPCYEKVGDAENLGIYRTAGYLGLGVMSDPSIAQWDDYNPNPLLSQSLIWETVTGQENVLQMLPMESLKFKNSHPVTQAEIAASGENGSLHIHTEDEDDHAHEETDTTLFDALELMDGYCAYKVDAQAYSVTYTLIPAQSQNIYLNVRAGLFDTVTVDGAQKWSFLGKRVMDIGYHAAGVPIEITLTCENERLFGGVTDELYDDAVYLVAAGLNDEAYQAGLQTLRENGVFRMTEFAESHLKGTVSAAKDGVMLMAMPYDEGWTVTVDGEAAELIEHSSHWMMFAVPAGEHDIEMQYSPLGLKEGAFVSAATLLMIFLVLLLAKMRAARFAEEDLQAAGEDVGENSAAVSLSEKEAAQSEGDTPPDAAD